MPVSTRRLRLPCQVGAAPNNRAGLSQGLSGRSPLTPGPRVLASHMPMQRLDAQRQRHHDLSSSNAASPATMLRAMHLPVQRSIVAALLSKSAGAVMA